MPPSKRGSTEKLFEDALPNDLYRMVIRILREQYEGGSGYNPGSQLIQIVGITMLDRFDHYCKEQLHARYYIRYMDDFLIISHDHGYLEECVERTKAYLSTLKFELNPKKTKITPLSDGIDFLGFKFGLTETGKVLMQIRPENVKRQRKKLFRLVEKSKRGEIPREKVDESYAAWRNHASKGNSYNLLKRIDTYYQNLWR